jgi:RNA-binding protein
VPLNGKQTQFLRALAHPLKPLVQVGSKGISDTLIQQISEQLVAHELIKVRFNTESVDPAEVVDDVLERTKCELVQKLGRTLILYKRHEESPKLELPGVKKKKREIEIASKAPTRMQRRRSKAVAKRREKRTDEGSGRAALRASKQSAASAPRRQKRPAERTIPGTKAAASVAGRTRRAPAPVPGRTRTRTRTVEDDES